MKRLVIFGTRGVAREIHQLILDLARNGEAIACKGFLVDDDYREASIIHELPVFGDANWLAENRDVFVSIGIGETAARHRIASLIEEKFGSPFISLKHPRCYLGDAVAIGDGTVVAPGVMATTDISVGRHVQLHIGCTIGHDVEIGDFVTVAPGANISGRVQVGEGVFVGAGAVILPDRKIGRWATIGAGAVVVDDIPANATVVGVPARIIAERPSGWHLGES